MLQFFKFWVAFEFFDLGPDSVQLDLKVGGRKLTPLRIEICLIVKRTTVIELTDDIRIWITYTKNTTHNQEAVFKYITRNKILVKER